MCLFCMTCTDKKIMIIFGSLLRQMTTTPVIIVMSIYLLVPIMLTGQEYSTYHISLIKGLPVNKGLL